MTVYIKPLSAGPETPPDQQTLQEWQARTGLILAADYISFLERYNGGFVYPLELPVTYPDDHPYFDEYEATTQLDHLYAWSGLVHKNSFLQPWDQKKYTAIADAVAGTILIKAAPPDIGSVHFWWRNNEAWDSGDEWTTTAFVAPSFRDFIQKSLRPGETLTSRWDQPDAFSRANVLTFD